MNISVKIGSSVFPNPVKEWLTVNGLQFKDVATLEIYNVLGEKVYAMPFARLNSPSSIEANISTLAEGIYFVKIFNEEKRWNGRFMKE